MKNRVYVVMGNTGKWEDYVDWHLFYCDTLGEARKQVKYLNELAKKVVEFDASCFFDINDTNDENWKKLKSIDSYARIDYNRLEYTYVPITKCESKINDKHSK